MTNSITSAWLPFLGHLILGTVRLLYCLYTKPNYRLKDMWYLNLLGWPFLIMATWWGWMAWRKLRKLDANDVEGFVRALCVRGIEMVDCPVNEQILYNVTYRDGGHSTFAVPYKALVNVEKPYGGLHLLAWKMLSAIKEL